jgi:hypothetical protein
VNPHACCKAVAAGPNGDSIVESIIVDSTIVDSSIADSSIADPSRGPSRTTSGVRIANGDPRARMGRRGLDLARWMVPSGILALLPKCPACLAAYFALGTGLGISVSTATYLRMAMLILCVASLAYLAAARGRKLMEKFSSARRPSGAATIAKAPVYRKQPSPRQTPRARVPAPHLHSC